MHNCYFCSIRAIYRPWRTCAVILRMLDDEERRWRLDVHNKMSVVMYYRRMTRSTHCKDIAAACPTASTVHISGNGNSGLSTRAVWNRLLTTVLRALVPVETSTDITAPSFTPPVVLWQGQQGQGHQMSRMFSDEVISLIQVRVVYICNVCLGERNLPECIHSPWNGVLRWNLEKYLVF